MQVLQCVIFDLTGTAASNKDFILWPWQGYVQRYFWKTGSQTRWAPSLRTHFLICPATNMTSFFSHRGSIGCVLGGDKWFCTHSNTQILPVWETDLCRSVGADGAHRKRPVRDRWLCSSTDYPDHHQSPECPSKLDFYLFQLLSDEAGVQAQGMFLHLSFDLNIITRNSDAQRPWAGGTGCQLRLRIFRNGVKLQSDPFCVFSVNTAIK